MADKIIFESFQAWYGSDYVLKGINLAIPRHDVTAIIGPSGSGKSTLLRCINRMHEVIPGARIEGTLSINGKDIYRGARAVEIRRKIGMIFQQPTVFAHMNIFDNIAIGLNLNGKKKIAAERVEDSLKLVGLWEIMKNRLYKSPLGLSLGQLQLICLSRVLAIEPDVLLLDEPCASLDPVATIRIEELIRRLKRNYTIVLVTHNMQQAARVSSYTAFLSEGEVVEFGATQEVFIQPRCERTRNYVTGRLL